jgi:hypothetical protein
VDVDVGGGGSFLSSLFLESVREAFITRQRFEFF